MTINLQQDNEKPHRIHNDAELLQKMSTMTGNVNLLDQPPNSPDLNVLDLRYFAAIQALKQRQQQRTVYDLIAAVDKSYKEFPSVTLAKIFVTLQKVMELVILHDGSNTFKLPHLGKDKALRSGMVLDTLLLLLTHGLVSFKLLYGLCRYALSAFVPPSVIPNLQKNSWRGQAIKQICE
jgi:hypothetical protein